MRNRLNEQERSDLNAVHQLWSLSPLPGKDS